ncbi:MAG: hypothetical protein ACLQCB_05910 [Spirochaetia bacterium]
MLLTFSPISSYNPAVRTSWEAGLLSAAFIVILILGLNACGSFAFLLTRPVLAGALSTLPSNPWWLVYQQAGAKDADQPLEIIGATVIATAVGLVFSLRSRTLHKHSRTPVLPYLLLFFLTMGVECLRGLTAVLYATDGAIPATVTLTRAVYWGRFVGLFALLLSSLYCTDLKYRHVYVLGGGSLLVALAIAASLPIDQTTFLSQLTWKLGDAQGAWFVNVVINALVLLTAVGASALKRDRRFLVVAGGFALLLVGRDLVFFMLDPLPLAGGIVALTAGAVVCLRSLGEIYRGT